jgi:hypothetical protein
MPEKTSNKKLPTSSVAWEHKVRKTTKETGFSFNHFPTSCSSQTQKKFTTSRL